MQFYLRCHSNPFSRLQGDNRVFTLRRAIQFNPPNTGGLRGASTREADFESEAEIGERLRFRRWLKVAQVRPDWNIDRSESCVEKTKLRVKCVQSDVCWRYTIKRNAQRTWVAWVGCPISNATAADTASHARLAGYAVGRG